MKYLRKFNESLEPKYTYTYTDLNIEHSANDYTDVNIDVNQLLTLNTGDVGVGDDVLVVYKNTPNYNQEYSVYRFTVEKIYGDELGFINNTGEDSDEEYILYEAYLVVKVETYNDFVNPELRIDE